MGFDMAQAAKDTYADNEADPMVHRWPPDHQMS